ncbi:VWA domain-containing protein [Kutzneria buriramensis]|uniref:Ca-activated chloride channel family protein n=1 Tax=Kutzneria buriramensis TaxID=1045776 RepID=A0A3E0H2T9_9PSEU|nr:VWA domain-containing protein [Kutzneria buriramensis]REH36340.1 Ca-activated chloride channel family protein [Kutzneria buriramensis]
MRTRLTALAVAALLTVGLAGCSGDQTDPKQPLGQSKAGVLRVLAGSELSDMQPILDEAAKATGVQVKFTFSGTLEGAQTVVDGKADGAYDAIWFSSNRYLTLLPGGQKKLGTQTKIMSSPVVLGLPAAMLQSLGWQDGKVTWSQIADAAGQRKFSYGMTDPSASNSGFSALVGVAAALAGSGSALTADQITAITPRLKQFFAAQTLSAGSSGWLSDAFQKRASGADPGPKVDGLINYESVLLEMNAGGRQPLTVIHPSDGVVTADYPLTLLTSANSDARDSFQRLTDHLRTPDVQRKIMDTTHRRPIAPQVPLAKEFTDASPVELPFPGTEQAVDTLVSAYFDKLRRPSRTVYVLDTSGSMEGDRLQGLQAALIGLTGVDDSLVGRYRQFHAREQVTLLPFSTSPGNPVTLTVDPNNRQPALDQIKQTADGLEAGGDTAIYTSLERAYQILEQQSDSDPDRFTSIVLMTDGENNEGDDLNGFKSFVAGVPDRLKGTPVFPVLFGEGSQDDMNAIAAATGGKVFDGRSESLSDVFKDIRGYQ